MLTILTDTRQKDSKHTFKENWFAENGIKTVNSKLPAGDYSLLKDMSRVVDTKRNLQELCGNLIQDHERFRREADFCKDNGIELIVLIEEYGMNKLEDVLKWENPRLVRYNKIKLAHQNGVMSGVPLPPKPPISNSTLFKIMRTFGEAHNVRWEFCNPIDSGRRVVELLTEGKET